MSKQRILIIEDEIKIARFLELELIYEGYEVEKAYDGREGLQKVINDNFDLIILDIMLPSMNGMEVLRKVRQTLNLPIIMLTAKDETMDKVLGLDMGADDYVTKPFAIEELLARIRVALKKSSSRIVEVNTNILQVKDLKVDLNTYTVTFKEDIIDLTKKEFDLLSYLMKNKNIVLTREKILDEVWEYDYVGDTNISDVYIRYLRSKIDDKYNEKFIYTIRGVGYVLKDE
ncbi:two-component signal transduction response regulator [Gottschalkia acidurici 9a]|uniref:Two-component signal transduction response regulator n=1 Tax=Gottschalkia acidurici (strain ATCC 7906 / DSM 604 / BCRC 14475 / CIP 104303 / KCTC 5404 / NCIMB 10678 / 9a) TaxID=1128398 RepID=K0B287_GOTA9|nr:response regulator transcription factor [Gottschalkia acidurici]AFS79604.1 two-component signal transduction response regulator [Gottschalkia acidurici 9a]